MHGVGIMKINDFELERYFAQHEFSAPYLLCCSDCETWSVRDLLQLEKGAEQDFNELRLGYTETLGNPELRHAISGLYSNSKPHHVMVCAGAEEGIFIFMNTILEPGDHMIVQFPCYQSLEEIALSIGCRVTRWSMDPDQNWDLDPDFLLRAITPKTKAIVVNFPHNPTGALISSDRLAKIVEIARQRDIFIFSDEVYRFLEYDAKDRLPSVSDIYEKSVSLGVMSKAFGLAGLRIGWLVTKQENLFQQMASFKDYTTICSSAPSEFLALLALRHKELILNRNLELIRHNLDSSDVFFEKFPRYFEWKKPKAGPVAFPKINVREGAENFCTDLVKEKGVLLMPGTQFHFQDRYVRFGFGRRDLPEVLGRLEEYLSMK